MQKYLDYLLADLAKIAANPPEPRKCYENGEEVQDEISNLFWELNESPEEKMSDIFGIESIAFPPATRLTEAQMEQLVAAFMDVWAAFNFNTDFPKYANTEDKYLFFVKYLNYETQYITNGLSLVTIKFCRFNRSKCPDDGNYCNCQREMFRQKKFWQEHEDLDLDLDDLDLDDLDLVDLDLGDLSWMDDIDWSDIDLD